MFEREDYMIDEYVKFLPQDRKRCALIAHLIMTQCIIAWIVCASILLCIWTPEYSTRDYDKLTRIMYLYDYDACGYKLNTTKLIANLHISNETFGLDIKPIRWLPVMVTVSTRLSSKTRKYIELSLIIHVVWFLLAVVFRFITKNSENVRTLKVALSIFFYSCIFVVGFDLSMAVVYITHIKQSLSKGMILRYSGWSTELKLDSYDDFAGWLPIAASIIWLRGFVVFMMNVYFCKLLSNTKRNIKRSEVKIKFLHVRYLPIPEPTGVEPEDDKVLIYRDGMKQPHMKTYNLFL